MIVEGIKPLDGGVRYCIGDIHGNKQKLVALMNEIGLKRNNVYYYVGDYIDRGFDSKWVLDYVIKISRTHRVQPLMGNHELMLLYAFYDESYGELWASKYGAETLASFGVQRARDVPTKYIMWIQKLPLVVKSGNFVISHAGVNFGKPDPYEDSADNRNSILFGSSLVPHHKYRSIVGHYTRSIATIIASSANNIVYVDGGCGKSNTGKLVAYCLDDDSVQYV